MPILPIYNCFHPVLSQKAAAITEITTEIKELVKNMFDTLYGTSNGVGLAANQVGQALAIFIIDVSDVDEYKNEKPFVCLNPVIVEHSEQTSFYEEGCLSAPDFYEDVERPVSIKIQYYDLDMQLIERELNGFLARVVQHEYDHLQGIVFYERISAFKRALNKNKLRHLKACDVDIDYAMIDAEGKHIPPQK